MNRETQTVAPEAAQQAKLTSEKRLSPGSAVPSFNPQRSTRLNVSLLTGGGDKPYALGLTEALTAEGIELDFIGSDDLAVSELLSNPRVGFLNLRGDQRSGVDRMEKVFRVLRYYWKLIRYAATAKPKIFHILWNNKFHYFDRTLLMVYYRLLGKRVVLTAHNVNAGKRDGNDSLGNRLSLKIQYLLCDHIFVHTERMQRDLIAAFGIAGEKVSVISFGINKTVPNTRLATTDAKARLGITDTDKTLLFFGNIAPYKGLHCLVEAFLAILRDCRNYRLIIAGRPKGSDDYWTKIRETIDRSGADERIIRRIEYVPDEETEFYFKAADVIVLPYTQIFQSGVLLLSYAFGLPVIAADVGSLREEIVSGETGFVFKSEDPLDLGRAIGHYFESDLYKEIEHRRSWIVQYAAERYSWSKVAVITKAVYSKLTG